MLSRRHTGAAGVLRGDADFAGAGGKPVTVVFVPPDPEAVGNAAQTLEGELESRSQLALDVITVNTMGEALGALCDYSDGDRFAAAWLSGPAAIVALERECGDVALQGVRGGNVALAGQVIGPAGSLRGAQGRTFCRLGVSDFYSWVLPTLTLQANGVEPTDLGDVVDYPSYELLLPDLTNGTCEISGIPAGLLETDDYSEYASQIPAFFTTTPMPYGVLVYPPELLLADREALTEAFVDAVGTGTGALVSEAADESAPTTPSEPTTDFVTLNENQLTTNQAALLALLGAEGVQPITERDLAPVREFMQNTGLLEALAQE